jgi:2,3-bisphosphoglycerate-independent phosphoglycerate mutase
MGRFYAMDRDKRWDRNERAYRAMVEGEGHIAHSVREAVEASYQAKITDEFMEPAVIADEQGMPLTRVSDGDAIIFFNFRADRARQITHAFVDHQFTSFPRKNRPETYYVCLTQYEATIKSPVAFLPQNLNDTLGEVLAEKGLRQLRIAETEKYAHVTFFFNGGVETPNLNEDRILIPSPRVSTYDLQPEMSAREVTDRVISEIEKDFYDVIILNYANPDMVGHTGVMEAAVTAIKTVDICLIRVVDKVRQKGGVVLVLPRAQIPLANNRRPIDASFFGTRVGVVRPVVDSRAGEVRIDIGVRGPPAVEVRAGETEVVLDFAGEG